MSGFRKILAALFLASVAMSSPVIALSEESQWEHVENVGESAKPVSKHPDIEVFTGPSVILINVHKPGKVEIFTILGRQVSSETLQAGSYEFRMKAHGVYIVKTEESTSKVAI